MITLYDHIQELRAELRGCYLTRRERATVQAELARAVAELAERDRAFDIALEALHNGGASRRRVSGPIFFQQLAARRNSGAANLSTRNPAHSRAADARFPRHLFLRGLRICSPGFR